MNELLQRNPLYFPLFFMFMWIGITTLLGFCSAWFFNMRDFPDNAEPAVRKFTGQSAKMGFGVSLNGVLTIEVCASGLRFRMQRIFGPFCRDFFVPWQSLTVTQRESKFFPKVILQFGRFGKIVINSWVADRIAILAKENWPFVNPRPPMALSDIKRHYFLRWAVLTFLASSFLISVPILARLKSGQRPPILVAVLFPAIVSGLVMIFGYLRDTKGFKK